MIRMIRNVFLAAMAAMLVAPPAPAQAQATHPVVGSWSIEYERGRRMMNGEASAIMGTADLRIEQQGDSLVATLQPAARPDGTPSPAATFVGRATAAGAVFVQKQTVQMNMNGEVSSREVTLTWTLQARGDALTGTLARELPGMPEPSEPSPVKGTRKTS